MIKLPKKIKQTIKNELKQDYSVLKRFFVETGYKTLNFHLIVLSVGMSNNLIILRYWSDNSYSFLTGYANMEEVKEEIAYQIKKLC